MEWIDYYISRSQRISWTNEVGFSVSFGTTLTLLIGYNLNLRKYVRFAKLVDVRARAPNFEWCAEYATIIFPRVPKSLLKKLNPWGVIPSPLPYQQDLIKKDVL